MLRITTERKGEWYVATSTMPGVPEYEHIAPTRMMALHSVLLQLMAKGVLAY